MKMKTILLALCIGLVFLGGCGRSKPQTSKTAEVDSPAPANTPPPPPDQLPPKPAAAPVPAPRTAAAPAPGAATFGPLPPNQDPAGSASLKKYHEEAAKMQQDMRGQESERKRLESLQSQPQSDNGQGQ